MHLVRRRTAAWTATDIAEISKAGRAGQGLELKADEAEAVAEGGMEMLLAAWLHCLQLQVINFTTTRF